MTMATDVYVDDDNTASCEAAARQEAEAGPSIRNNQTMRGKNGRKLVTATSCTVTMPPLTTTTTTMSTMSMADDAAFDDDDDNVDDGDGATGVGYDGDGGGATGAAVNDDDEDGGYDDGDGATTATVTATERRRCA